MRLRPIALGLLFAAAIPAQDNVIRVTSKEVLVDVVVRDKKGRIVHKLTANDFKLGDDAVPQKIVGFREVSGGTVTTDAGSNEPGAPKSAQAAQQVRLVSLVFDRLGVDSRRLARQGALELLKNEVAPNTYYGVFFVDQRLRIIQGFTSDRVKLRAAVEKVTAIGASDFANDNASLNLASGETSGSDGAAASAANSGGAPVNSGGMANESMNRMVDSMLSFSNELSRDQQGRSSIYGLFAIIREQIRLPGRKALVYFSEGLVLPNSLWTPFQTLITAANRANVSVYSVDARGLKVQSDQIGASAALATATGRSYRQATSVETGPVARGDAMIFDQALDSIRANTQATLGELAEGTGGTLIANTNDFRVPLRRVIEELDSHYEIAYQPTNANLDGRFHAVSVTLERSDAIVQARNGYFALPSLDGLAVYPYEVPLLNAVAKSPLPRAFEFRSTIRRFLPKDGVTQASLIFDLPLRDITFAKDEERKIYKTHVSLMALVKDPQGRVVASCHSPHSFLACYGGDYRAGCRSPLWRCGLPRKNRLGS